MGGGGEEKHKISKKFHAKRKCEGICVVFTKESRRTTDLSI